MQKPSTPVIGWLALVGSMLLGGAAGGAPALAQVSGASGVLGLGTRVNGVDGGSCSTGQCGVSGGTSSGNNLFHRFSTFDTRGGITGVNVQTGGHRNLFVGVTSPLGSFINQPISLTMPGNLFWLSPGGIAISGAGGFQNVQRLQLSTATGMKVGSGLFDAFGTTAAEAALLNGSPLLGLAGLVSDQETLGGMGLNRNGDLEIDGGLLTVDRGMLLDAQGGHVLLAGSRLEVRGGDGELSGDVVRLENSAVDTGAADPQGTGGSITIRGGTVLQNGDLLAQGASGGSVLIEAARDLQSSGRIDASGTDGPGGSVALEASGDILQTNQSVLMANGNGGGGRIKVQAGGDLISSARYQADGLGQGALGGVVELGGKEVVLLAAQASADGPAGGGSVRVGGGSQGAGLSLGGRKADAVAVNPATILSADATDSGNGGEVVVGSERNTIFQGGLRARGGPSGGDGGRLDVSSSQDLSFTATADGSAPQGTGGTLQLVAENILIDANAPIIDFLASGLLNPTGQEASQGVTSVTTLSNGNVIAVDLSNDFLATDAGAVYQFNGSDGALQSILRGDTAASFVGSGGITELENGNYVINSPSWDNGLVVDAGAVTWASGSSGITAVVNETNSLVGGRENDRVGSGGITALGDGNYLVSSPNWTGLGSDLVVNGSFEDPQIPQLPGDPFTNKFRYFPDSELGSLPGWTSVVSDRPIEIQTNACCTAFDGTQHVEIDSDGNGRIRQDISTSTGGDYQLIFAYSPQVGRNKATNGINVYWGGALIDTLAEDGGLEDTVWQVRTINVQASGNQSPLEFEAIGTSDQVGGLIDAVKLLPLKTVGAVTQGNGFTGTTGVVSPSNSVIGSTTGNQGNPNGATTLPTSNLLVSNPSADNSTAVRADALGFSGNSLSIRAGNSIKSIPGSNITLNGPIGSMNDLDFTLEAGRSILLESGTIRANGFKINLLAPGSNVSQGPQNQEVATIKINDAKIYSTGDIKLLAKDGSIELTGSSLTAPDKAISVQSNVVSIREESLIDASDARDGSLGGMIDISGIQGVEIIDSRLITSGIVTGGSISIGATDPASTVDIVGSDLVADPAGEGGSILINGGFIAVTGGAVIVDGENDSSLLDVTGSTGGQIRIGTSGFTKEILLDETTILQGGPNASPLQLEADNIVDLSTKFNIPLPTQPPSSEPAGPSVPPGTSEPPRPAVPADTSELPTPTQNTINVTPPSDSDPPNVSTPINTNSPPQETIPPLRTNQPPSTTTPLVTPADDRNSVEEIIASISGVTIQPTDYVDNLQYYQYTSTPLNNNTATNQFGLNQTVVALDQLPSFSYMDDKAFTDLQAIQFDIVPFTVTEISIQQSSTDFTEAEQQAAKEVSDGLGIENKSTASSVTPDDVQKALQQMIKQARCKRNSSEPECN